MNSARRWTIWRSKTSWKLTERSPAARVGCCSSTKGPISTSASGRTSLAFDSNAVSGAYVRSSVVVKGPAAAISVTGWTCSGAAAEAEPEAEAEAEAAGASPDGGIAASTFRATKV